jgi:hypothetical protein
MKYTSHRPAIMNNLSVAFEKTAIDLAAFYKDEFENKIWDWPRTTTRVNGETVSSPRNIVDTGALRDSQKLEIENSGRSIGKVKAIFRWEDEKASGVFLGETIVSDAGKSYELPARNLPIEGLARFNFPEIFEIFARAELG